MAGKPTVLGPFKNGMHNSSGKDFIADTEVFELTNLEVDTNGTLVNRPAVQELTWTLGTSKSGVRVLGSFLPSDGRRFLVIMTGGAIRLMDLTTNTITISSSTTTLTNATVVQYRDKLVVAPGPQDTASSGGYFDIATPGAAVTWTTVAAIPQGGAIFLYKERLWIVAGLQSTGLTVSRIRFSAVADPATWNGSDFIDIYANNGEKLVYGLVLGNDIVLFKQHSTYILSYDTSPSRAVVRQISSNIGVPVEGCAVQYDNSVVYLMHGGAVYEMYNYIFTRVSDNINMSNDSDVTLYTDMVFGLSIYRDRLFVRYYNNLYCYALKTNTWSRWVTVNKFSRLIVVPSTSLGVDLAYAASASSSKAGSLYYILDSRTTGVGTNEAFDCGITTKVYEFDVPFMFKRLWYWGLEIATSGTTTASAVLPNTGQDATWDADSTSTWNALANTPWGSSDDLMYTSVVPPDKGSYAKKYYKLPRAFRFKRLYFVISTPAISNTIDNSSVRIFDIIAFIRTGQMVEDKVN